MGLRPYSNREVQRLLLGGALGGLLGTALERHGTALQFWGALFILISFLFSYSLTAGRTGEWGFARERSGARAANVS